MPIGDAPYTMMLDDTPAPWCWACGRDNLDPPPKWYGPFTVERAHLSAGSGRMRRELDRRAVILLCSLCHRLHHHHPGSEVKINGQLMPRLTDANAIYLKRLMDSRYWDEAYIRHVWTGYPPDPEAPHPVFQDQYHHRRGHATASTNPSTNHQRPRRSNEDRDGSL